MNLHTKLLEREAAGRPVTVAVIGAGKFGTMFLRRRASRRACMLSPLPISTSVGHGVNRKPQVGRTKPMPLLPGLMRTRGARRSSPTTPKHSLPIRRSKSSWRRPACPAPASVMRSAIANGKHIVMVNVEADAVAGPLLARRAKAAGVVYSLAWGDQPALICEHVDWARAAGFKVICAGKGTRYEPHYHKSNPDNVWDILDKYLNISDRKSINPKMFNSFVDGTKSGIEMTAVCNATGLVPQSNGLGFPPATRFELAEICKPKSDGGTLEKAGVTEVTSSVYRDGRDVPHHLALGTYVVFEGDTEYARRCFKEYAMLPDKTGKYAALYRPIHMIGLELGISVASAALRNEPTGAPNGFRSDVVATAKRALKAGEMLDGEGGFCVWGRQTPADVSLDRELLPLGLAHNVKLKADIAEGQALRWSDVAYDPNDSAVKVRREMEAAFGRRNVGAEATTYARQPSSISPSTL